MLEWQKQCNQPLKHFTVQRSINGTVFTDIAEVKSNNNNSVIYHLTDNVGSITAKAIYYRLIAIALDDKSYYSPVVILQHSKPQENVVRLISNPARASMEFSYTLIEKEEVEFVLFGAGGNRLTTVKNSLRKGETRMKYSFPSGSPSGVYYVHIRLNGDLKVFKVQKQ